MIDQIRKRERERQWRLKNPEKVAEYSRRHTRAWQIKNPEKVKEMHVRWRLKNPEKAKASKKYPNYIEPDIFQNFLNFQDFKCAICKIPYDSKIGAFVVDHSHFNGRIRGILCRLCNNLLGFAKDDVVILIRAIRYLQRNRIHRFEDLMKQKLMEGRKG